MLPARPMRSILRRGLVFQGLAWLLLLAGSVLVGSVSAAGPSREVVTVEGKPFAARFSGLSREGDYEFDADGTPRSIPAVDLVRFGEFVDSPRGAQVLLAGGVGRLVADIRELGKEQLVLESDALDRRALPLDSVAAVVLHPPTDPRRRDQFIRGLLSAGSQSDRVVLDNGDELTGSITTLSGDVLELDGETGKIDVEAARVAALVFDGAPGRTAAARGERVWIGWSDGSRLLCEKLTAEAGKLRLTLAGGLEFTVPAATIVAIEPLGGRAVYLSDLKPAGYKHIPLLRFNWPYDIDRNVAGDQLRAGGRLFLKGLGMHSAARLTYDLPAGYRKFETLAAIDDRAAGQGSVVFRVFVDDGSGNWQARFTSPTVRGGDPPLPISVSLEGAKRLSLLVEFADRGDELDDADWLEARLVK